jgi:hypothetical protein
LWGKDDGLALERYPQAIAFPVEQLNDNVVSTRHLRFGAKAGEAFLLTDLIGKNRLLAGCDPKASATLDGTGG